MTETILPHQLPTALERAPDGARVLSLDCFDTLLWRDCYAPADLFAELSDVTIGQRAVAEKQARKAEGALRERSEVGLEAIYAHAMPNASAQKREAAIAAELEVEAQSCFAFAPTVELMREAKARGLTVIIVSDTYLNSDQLRRLIAASAGEEVAGMIDRVFASSELGLSKSQGLLAKAIKAMRRSAGEVLHIGDNQTADFDSARALGIPALHLEQFTEAARRRMRLERACQQLTGDSDNGVRGLMPQRALLASKEPRLDDSAQALGMTVLGPIFHGFDQWLRQEAAALQAQTKGKVHWLFMLRDGHLPQLVHQCGGEAESTARVEISRFTAIAASLTSREAYHKQWSLEYGLNPSTLARQMLMEEDEVARIVGDPQGTAAMVAACEKLRKELRTGAREKLTRRRSRAFAERLVAHVRASVNPQPGDTLMLVDLGYNGSAQDRVDSLLAEAFGVHVAGRYLLLRETAATGLDKKGLLDARHFDAEWLEALCGNVAVIEQLATCELGSVVDFTDEGEPIRKDSAMKGAQSAVRDRVQAGTLRFATAAAKASPIIRAQDIHAERGWREAVAGVLTRFMFLPQPQELAVLKSFEHDVNIGSNRMVALFDADLAREGMRRRGLFYMKGSERMFLPAELAQEDMSTRLSLLVQKRFGLGLSYADQSAQTLAIPAIYLGARDSSTAMIEAQPTHEGYYTARLPVPPGAKGVALQVGSVFEWFELSGITLSPLAALKGEGAVGGGAVAVPSQFEGVKTHAPGLLECTDPAAFLLVNPPPASDKGDPQMIEIVLRPVRFRPKQSAQPSKLQFLQKEAAA